MPPEAGLNDTIYTLWVEEVRVAGAICRASHEALSKWAGGK